MDPSDVAKSIHANLDQYLEKMEPHQIKLLAYMFQGIADGSIRDLSWTIGRKAGRIHIQQG